MIMRNREYVQLAHVYDPVKHGIAGWYMSEKLDGMRCLWDGGISCGLQMKDVPYANLTKGENHICTGFWSRYGKPIHAPNRIIQEMKDRFPFMMDGELWCGRGRFQEVVSKCKTRVNTEEEKENVWKDVKYMIFDCPSYSEFASFGKINNIHTKIVFDNKVTDWIGKVREIKDGKLMDWSTTFESRYARMCLEITGNEFVQICEQIRLPWSTDQAIETMRTMNNMITDMGGEGLILRDPNSTWEPRRNQWMVKVKKLQDMEGMVVGWNPGVGKYLGMMGSLKIRMMNGKVFDLGGFTDEERRIYDGNPVHFVNGQIVTFRYREMTLDGMPKEARFWRGL